MEESRADKRELILVVDEDASHRRCARDVLEQAGFAACEGLRELPGTLHTPILLMTAHDDVDAIDRAYAAGATDFVEKPVNWQLLRYRVRSMLRAHRDFEDLRTSQRRLAKAQRIARLGSWEWDPSRDDFRFSNELLNVFGFRGRAESYGSRDFIERIHPDDRGLLEDALRRCASDGEPVGLDLRLEIPDQSERFIHTDAHVVWDERGRPARVEGTSQDVTARKRAEQEIRYLAFHDGLTRLPNRRQLRELVARAIKLADRDEQMFCVLSLGLDDFKRVNETFGHRAGDKILRSVARRLSQVVRRSDCVARSGPDSPEPVARLGGDEFAIVLNVLRHEQSAADVARRIVSELSRPFEVADQELVLGASVGIAVWPSDGRNVETLLRNADAALSHAKGRGQNAYQFYSESMNVEARRRISLEANLRTALRDDELEVFYQPQIEARTGAVAGFEALMRWDNPASAAFEVADLAAMAEETGLIVPIGERVLRTACRQARAWVDRGVFTGRVAVNVSGRQLRTGRMLETVQSALEDAGLPGRHLELEITETILMEDVTGAAELLRSMADLDITVAIDDFGTGYSSLQYLRELPVHSLKIDRSFIREIGQSSDADELVSAIISMARGLRLDVVAEGVETEAQRDFLTERGCTYLQGFLISPARPAGDLEPLLRG